MADFLLIHGSCHGAWCWRDAIPALAALGHSARAIDLPSHGADTMPAADVTLDAYARAIVAAITSPVFLVGHSMAGYPITAAAELAPDRIARLVYLCAYVPRAGHTLADLRRMAPTQPLRDAVVVDRASGTFTVDPAKAADLFYHDMPPDLAAWATARLCPQPIRPQETVLTLDRSGRIPRSYIRCTDDRTIPPDWQDAMTQDWPAADVTTLPASHSPFLSDPRALARCLHAIAQG